MWLLPDKMEYGTEVNQEIVFLGGKPPKSEIKMILSKIFSRSQNIRIIVETVIEVLFSSFVSFHCFCFLVFFREVTDYGQDWSG